MRVITVNVNGIRSAAGKGFFPWVTRQRADVVCLQEVRAGADHLAGRAFRPPSLHCHYLESARAGYSGVALLSRAKPERVVEGLGWPDIDPEARYLEAHFGRLAVVSLYVPSGTSGEERQAVKMGFLERFARHLRELRRSGREYIICGDVNIAHKPIDLRNWRSNQKNSGFLPEERAWLDTVFDDIGYVDAFRVVNQAPDQYTWWSNRGRAYENNVGWRIDYHLVSPDLADRVESARIYKRRKFSDHAPLTIDYSLPG